MRGLCAKRVCVIRHYPGRIRSEVCVEQMGAMVSLFLLLTRDVRVNSTRSARQVVFSRKQVWVAPGTLTFMRMWRAAGGPCSGYTMRTFVFFAEEELGGIKVLIDTTPSKICF